MIELPNLTGFFGYFFSPQPEFQVNMYFEVTNTNPISACVVENKLYYVQNQIEKSSERHITLQSSPN
jgi:hypothetical protein